MVDINLLPWRIYFHEYLKNQILKYGIIVLILVLVAYVTTFWVLRSTLRAESEAVALLQKQVVAVNQATTPLYNSQNNAALNLFTKYRRNQQQLTVFFEQLIFASAGKIIWQSILSQGAEVILVGQVTSWQILLDFVRSFEGVNKLFHADIIKVKSLPQSNDLEFSVRFSAVLLPLPKSVEK
jgi:Tfp pilus assembly protein PilN